jgi:hypothetical protein
MCGIEELLAETELIYFVERSMDVYFYHARYDFICLSV